MTQISSSIWLTVNITTALILTYVFINTQTHTHTHTDSALTLDIVQFGSLLLQLRLQRLGLGFERPQSVAGQRRHLLRGHFHQKTQDWRRKGLFWWRETETRSVLMKRDTEESLERSGARGWCGCRDVTKDSLSLIRPQRDTRMCVISS